MKALLKIEWIKTWRTWPIFIMAIGMPVGFFLFYSGMDFYADVASQKAIIQSYMLTMAAFSMSSFGFFTFPFMLSEDKNDHWLSYIEHSPIPIGHYYLSKVFRVLLNFACSITVTFLVGALVRHVNMPLDRWIGAALLLLVTGLLYLAFGLLIAQIPSQQVMSIVGNIAFLALAIIGGSWMPIENFPDWLQKVSKVSPLYHVNQLVVTFAKDGTFLWKSALAILIYGIIGTTIALAIKRKSEVD